MLGAPLCTDVKMYSTAVDMWSLGCIMAELLKKQVLFHGSGEIEQLQKIFTIMGAPNETVWPGWSKLPGAKLVRTMLCNDSSTRTSVWMLLCRLENIEEVQFLS